MLFANILREIFFPNKCLMCHARGIPYALCDDCLKNVPLHNSLFCGHCHARYTSMRRICHPDVPYLLAAAGNYSDTTFRILIHALKFRRRRNAAEPLAELLFKYYKELDLDLKSFTIVPLPLSSRRKRERGFNQSELIANYFAMRANLPMATNILIRSRHSHPQSNTNDASEREANVRGAFAVKQEMIAPQNVILIDDVTTSGATLREAAFALKSAGTRRIIALTCAKA